MMASRIDSSFKFPMHDYEANSERYLCRIRHVETPESFFITLTANELRYNELFDELQRVYKQCMDEKRITPLDQIKIGDHCIYRHDPFYLRGQVLGVRDDGRLQMVDVDTGEVSSSISNRSLFPVINNCLFRQTPMLAPHCKLPYLVPRASSIWSEETIKYFIDNYTERQLLAEFLSRDGDLYAVKLYMKKSEREVSDHMITMGLARRHRPVVVEFTLPALDLQARRGDTINAIVCHVESPSSFFVQLGSNEDLISKLSRDLFREYMLNGDNYTNFNPVKGQHCVAKYDVDHGWYRAQILARLSPSMFEVQFIDYGNKARVHVRDLRKLRSEFARFAEQAVHCCLRGVRSLPVLSDRFIRLAESQRMVIQIDDVDRQNCLLSVTLFQTVGSTTYNINEYLAGRAGGPPMPRRPILGVAPHPFPDNEFDLGSDDDDAPGPSWRRRNPSGPLHSSKGNLGRSRHHSRRE